MTNRMELGILAGCSVLPPMSRPLKNADKEALPKQTCSTNEKNSAKNPRTSNRFLELNYFVDITLGRLTRNELAVWMILFRDTKPNGMARTSQSDIARRAKTSDRSVRRSIAALKAKGLLEVVQQGNIGQGCSTYRVYSLPPEVKIPLPAQRVRRTGLAREKNINNEEHNNEAIFSA